MGWNFCSTTILILRQLFPILSTPINCSGLEFHCSFEVLHLEKLENIFQIGKKIYFSVRPFPLLGWYVLFLQRWNRWSVLVVFLNINRLFKDNRPRRSIFDWFLFVFAFDFSSRPLINYDFGTIIFRIFPQSPCSKERSVFCQCVHLYCQADKNWA